MHYCSVIWLAKAYKRNRLVKGYQKTLGVGATTIAVGTLQATIRLVVQFELGLFGRADGV